MKTIVKRILSFMLIFLIILLLLPQNVNIANAASSTAVYEYLPMLEDRGNIYYIQNIDDKEYSFDLYRLEIATGNKTKLLSSNNEILSMMIHNNNLYYTCYVSEEDVNRIYSVSINGKDKKTICNGYLQYLDDSSIYYTVTKGEESKLYKKEYSSKKATLVHTGNLSLRFVKNIDGTRYFTQFDEVSSKLTLYTLKPGQTKLTVLTTDKIQLNGSERTFTRVSDIIKINGDYYYQYGAEEGSGNYWYGKLVKLNTSTNKKSVIVKQLYEEEIFYYGNSIFYNDTDSSDKHYQYNTKTNKTTTYIYKTTGTESFNILGDKTYCAKTDGKESVVVSRFTSGTNKKNLVESFISISYKQKKEFEYSASVKEYGNYLLIPVTCMDYSDTSNGWRGRCVSVTWYVANSDGKILAQFQ